MTGSEGAEIQAGLEKVFEGYPLLGLVFRHPGKFRLSFYPREDNCSYWVLEVDELDITIEVDSTINGDGGLAYDMVDLVKLRELEAAGDPLAVDALKCLRVHASWV